MVIYLFYPETKGRSLEQRDEIFLQSQIELELVKVAKTLPVGIDIMATIEAYEKRAEIEGLMA